jgi:hypothetical protein
MPVQAPPGKESHMSLMVVPLKNHLASCPSPYIIRTNWSDSVKYTELVDIMASGRTTLTKPDISGCLELFVEEIAKLVADGKYVKTPLGAFYLCASGKFDAPDEAFTPGEGESSHDVKLHFRAEKSLEAQILTKVKIERLARFDRNAPTIYSSASVKTDQEMRAGAGDFIRVQGSRLKFDKANAAEGLFFINGEENRAAQYATILPGLVIAQVPPGLMAGDYTLAVRSMQGGKELHEGRFATLFTVE